MRRKGLAAGIAIAALYVGVALVSFDRGLFPVRPLYDGSTPPPPYRWVDPPQELAAGNQLPSDGKGTVSQTNGAFDATSISTDDGQAQLLTAQDGFVHVPGETKVVVEVEPVDSKEIGNPPPGFDYDGNAYRYTATYQKSGKPAQLPPAASCPRTGQSRCSDVVLRYAFNATALYRHDGSKWVEVPSTNAGAALQIYGGTDELGVFVAVDPHLPGGPKKKSQTGNILAFVFGFLAILGGTFFARVRAVRRRKRTRQAKGARGKVGQRKGPAGGKRAQ